MPIQSINPATGETLRSYDDMSPREVKDIIGECHRAFLNWRRTGFADRSLLMKNAAAVLRENAEDYARLMALEMGKVLREGRAEVEKCAWVCEYYAENAQAFLAPEAVQTDATRSFIAFQPLGVVLAVMPWNFPFWQVFRFAAPGLMAGNVGVLKHASNVPGCALAIEEVFRRAGFPEHVFRTLLIGAAPVEAVIEDPLVRAVTLTGSTPAGRAVARKSGEMLKKTVLELGGATRTSSSKTPISKRRSRPAWRAVSSTPGKAVSRRNGLSSSNPSARGSRSSSSKGCAPNGWATR